MTIKRNKLETTLVYDYMKDSLIDYLERIEESKKQQQLL